MSDHVEMRFRLQKVAAYRELCRGVRRSGRENVIFALVMLSLGYFAYENGAAAPTLVLFGILICGELLVGLFKWLAPSAEGVLLDGIVLLVFAVYNLGIAYLQFQAGRPISPVIILLGAFMLLGAIGRFKAYGQFRVLFAERPDPEHMAWFDGLVDEIRASDPQADDQTLDLPTVPHWKAKLLGPTAFFVAVRGGAVWVAGPDDFEIVREKTDHGTGRRRALLRILGQHSPEFEVTDATWVNYAKWRMANAPPTPATPTA